jgi:hypothetical protein
MPSELILGQLLYGVLIPALVAGTVLVLARALPWQGSGARAGGGALACGAAFAAGHIGMLGPPSWPPAGAMATLLWVALGAAVLGGLEGFLPPPERRVLRLLASAALPFVLLPGPLASWSLMEGAANAAALTAVTVALWSHLGAISARQAAAPFFLLACAVSAATSAVALSSGSALIAQLAGVLAAALGAAFALGCLRPRARADRGAAAVTAVVLAGLWTGAFHLGEAPLASIALLAGASLTGWLLELRPLKDAAPWKAAIIGLAAALPLLGLAVALAAGGGASPGDHGY